MVSFFGLKIGGGDKKKKTTKGIETSTRPKHNHQYQDSFDDGEWVGIDGGYNPSYSASVSSIPRPGTAQSSKTTKTARLRARTTPYASQQNNGSMTALPSPHKFSDSSYSLLRQHSSNPNLGNRWGNGSSTSLALPPPKAIGSASRPGTPEGRKAWVDPLDVHFAKDSSSVAAAAAAISQPIPPKSPLGQYELKLNLPSDATSLFDDFRKSVNTPEPLRIRRPATSPKPQEAPIRSPSPMKPPSPPQSVKADDAPESPILSPLSPPLSHTERPSSRSSSRSRAPSSLKRVQNAREIPNYGPTAIPSPLATPRVSEDKQSVSSMNLWGEPVIQNVRARRDTMTSSVPARRSLEMRVEELEKASILAPPQRPKTSNGRTERPSPLKLTVRPEELFFDVPDSAPLMTEQRPQTPTGRDSPRLGRGGAPPAAVGALSRPLRDTSAVRRPTADDYSLRSWNTNESSLQSRQADEYSLQSRQTDGYSLHSRQSSDASSNYDEPPDSPESPVLPLTGPLAAPRFPLIGSHRRRPETDFSLSPAKPALSQQTKESPTRPVLSEKERNMMDSFEFVSPPPISHHPLTPDSTEWPLPSPMKSSFDAPRSIAPEARAASPFRAVSPFRTVSPLSAISSLEAPRPPPLTRPESPLLEPPRLLAPRPESPSFRSFSRPWTPMTTNEPPPPLKRGGTAGPRAPPKRSDTAPSSAHRDASFVGLRPPPPRSATTASHHRGLRSPAIVGNDFGGGGFI